LAARSDRRGAVSRNIGESDLPQERAKTWIGSNAIVQWFDCHVFHRGVAFIDGCSEET